MTAGLRHVACVLVLGSLLWGCATPPPPPPPPPPQTPVCSSYFALDDSFGPVDYRYTMPNPVAGGRQTAVARTGTTLGARVAATQFTLSYGVARRIEVDVSIPVVVVDASGGQVLSLDRSASLQNNLGIGFGDNPRDLRKKIRSGDVKIRTYSFSQLRDVGHVPVDFNEGTSVGLGRISMGTKASVFETGRFGLGAACDFYFPSPSEREYAGSDSASIFPVLIGTFRLADRARQSADAGYDYDFDVQQLRRFVW